MAKCRSDNTEKQQRNLIPYKPGQSGNPKGRPRGSRNKISEAFLRDFLEAWLEYGRPALMTAAMTDPVAFVRVAVMLLPREVDQPITNINADRLTDDELATIIDRGRRIIDAGSRPDSRDEAEDTSGLH